MKEIVVQQARASEADLKAIADFIRAMEEVDNFGTYTPLGEDGELDESREIDASDFRTVGELFSRFWNGPAMNRIYWGYRVMLENCCDPDSDVLNWRPDVREFLESKQQKGSDPA